MILTVTANASLDRLLFIPEFLPTTNMRVQKNLDAVGGKGFDVSVALKGMGVESKALGFAAGIAGEQLLHLLRSYGIEPELLWVAGDTRIAHVVIETRWHRHSHITSTGYTITPPDQERFLAAFRNHLPAVDWCIMSGSLPPGAPADFYATLVMLAQEHGIQTLVDCAGAPAVAAAAARPTILKMNRAELTQSFGVSGASLQELAAHAHGLQTQFGLENLVITCGSEGILALTSAGAWLATPPAQQEVNAAGAGDAASGALAWRLQSGDGWPDALRWAAAVSAAVVLSERTAECKRSDAERIYPEVTVRFIDLNIDLNIDPNRAQ